MKAIPVEVQAGTVNVDDGPYRGRYHVEVIVRAHLLEVRLRRVKGTEERS